MPDRARQRVLVLRVLVLSLVATLLGRLWFLQVLSGPTYQQAALANQVRTLTEAAPRGLILDDEGRPLARNRYEYVVTVNSSVLTRRHDHGAAVLARLAPVIGMNVAELKTKIRLCGPKVPQPCYTGSPYQPVPVTAFNPDDQAQLQKALVVEEKSELFPGVAISEQPVRVYPYRALAGQELGYIGQISAQELTSKKFAGYAGDELVGKGGLEYEYDRLLRGQPATRRVSVNAAGDVTGTLSTTQPTPGDYLVTNLDAALQAAVEKELIGGIKLAQSQTSTSGVPYLATTASAVVVDVTNGAVLALASLPNYDPNEFIGGISQKAYDALSAPTAGNPLISRAYDAAFPPGSTFKGSSSTAILANGLTTPLATTPCPSAYQVGNFVFHNFEGEASAPLTITEALERSCDTYFYYYGFSQWLKDGGFKDQNPLGPAKEIFAKTAKDFGYGSSPGLDLPEQSAGVVYDRAALYRYWQQNKAQYCKGAQDYARTDPQRSSADQELCTYGYRLYAGNAVQFAIGQGANILASPLQQAMTYAAIGNGGTVWRPQLAKAFLKPDGSLDKLVAPQVKHRLSAAEMAALPTVREGLKLVVQGPHGTAAGAGFPAALDVGGKTGTADVADTGPLNGQPEAWFTSLQPISKPKYAVVVLIEHGGQGGIAAATTAANIYKDMYGLGGHPAVWPGGQRPTALPRISPTGAIAAPQRHLPQVAPVAPHPGGSPDPVAVQAAEQAQRKAKAAAAKAASAGGSA